MNKRIKIILIVISLVILLGVIFGIVFGIIDSNRVNGGKKPIFCINIQEDNKESCWGLGYKWEKETVITYDPLFEATIVKFGLWINPKMITTENEYNTDDTRSCDNDINLIHKAEDDYYSNEEKLKFPFTIEIKEKKNCTNEKEFYYRETIVPDIGDTYTVDYYLYCLDDVIIHFDSESMSLKDAIENKKVTMQEIEQLIPYQVHLYFGKQSYIHSNKYGFAKNGLSIHHNVLNRYFIGPISMCDDGTFSSLDCFYKDVTCE